MVDRNPVDIYPPQPPEKHSFGPHHLHVSRHKVLRCHVMADILFSQYQVLAGLNTVTYHTNELMSCVLWVLPDSFVGAVRFRHTSGYRGGIHTHSILALFELYVNNDFTGWAVIEVSVWPR